ncbi:hypothetical protein SMITH_577 [Smithella sp. ME-1]|uniref:Uncharacterized protein n=1 Tax=hydrocarbon metagenome TaxID=938273 RepID=A0A0W8FRL7_9ZZZZ|nr:hypothetical protein SMITH_577 [Smithella sp. ME-1]
MILKLRGVGPAFAGNPFDLELDKGDNRICLNQDLSAS